MYDCDSLEIPIRTKILALMHVIHYILPSLLSSCHMHLDFFSLTFGDFTLLWLVPFYICVVNFVHGTNDYMLLLMWVIWCLFCAGCVIDVESIQWSGEKHGLRGHELNLFYKNLIDLMLDVLNFFFFLYL